MGQLPGVIAQLDSYLHVPLIFFFKLCYKRLYLKNKFQQNLDIANMWSDIP